MHRTLSAIYNNGVSTFQGELYTGSIGPNVGTSESVRIIEVSTFQGCPQAGFHCIWIVVHTYVVKPAADSRAQNWQMKPPIETWVKWNLTQDHCSIAEFQHLSYLYIYLVKLYDLWFTCMICRGLGYGLQAFFTMTICLVLPNVTNKLTRRIHFCWCNLIGTIRVPADNEDNIVTLHVNRRYNSIAKPRVQGSQVTLQASMAER